MKTLLKTAMFGLLALTGIATAKAQSPIGAWKAESNGVTNIMLVTDNYFTITSYDASGFKSTMGGTWQGTDNGATTHMEFNSADKTQVNQKPDVEANLDGDQLSMAINGQKFNWVRIDDGNNPLAGVWRITSREADGQMREMQAGPRKTIKILTGTKFQWVAINTETGEFFGTGGGSYTFADGVYTEKLEYFSRDNSRVGSSLTFKGVVEGNKWDHSGKSSKGDPIHEVWTR